MGSNTSSLVIDRLCAKTRGEDIAIAMFYCDFHHNQEQTSTDIMGAILKQLMVRREVQKLVQKAFQRARVESGSRGRPLPDMMTIVKQATSIATIPRVLICIDALDECLPKHLLELLGLLKDILQESLGSRIFVTGM